MLSPKLKPNIAPAAFGDIVQIQANLKKKSAIIAK